MGSSIGKKNSTTEAKETKTYADSDVDSESGQEAEGDSDDSGDASESDGNEPKSISHSGDDSAGASSKEVKKVPEEATDQEETPSSAPESGEPSVHAEAQRDEATEKTPKTGSTEMGAHSSEKGGKFTFPPHWMEKCLKDSKWCDKLLREALASHRTKGLFGGKKRPKLSESQKKAIKKECSKLKDKKKAKSCGRDGRLREQMKMYLLKRSGYLAGDFKGLPPGAWVAIIIGVALLVGAIVLYFIVFTKQGGKGAKKGSSSRSKSSRFRRKSSKLKSKAGSGAKMRLKSKRAKSRASKGSKLGNRKSSRKSRKKSVRSMKSTRTGKSKK